jgi:sulfide:quinone oxidoreductase
METNNLNESKEIEGSMSESLASAQENLHFDVVIVGAGSGGVAVSSSLLKRNGNLRIALVDPAKKHYYQPGWTMVGGGVFSAKSTERETHTLLDKRVSQIHQLVSKVEPDANSVSLQDGSVVSYDQLVMSPGLTLNWGAIEGLEKTLGKNGVTSNYRYDLAPYTWELVQKNQAW